MVADRYLDVYKKICQSDARLHLKTDDDELYNFTLENLRQYGCTIHQNIRDVHNSTDIDDDVKIRTYYEGRHIAAGLTIKYIQFTLPNEAQS